MRLLVVPNSSMVQSGETLYGHRAEAEFAAELLTRFSHVGFAAVTQAIAPRGLAPLPPGTEAETLRVIRASAPRMRREKLRDYACVALGLWHTLNRYDFAYLFCVGNVSLISAALCWIQRRKYAIYLRSDWPRTGLVSLLWKLAFRKAEFVIATGPELRRSVESEDLVVECVVPMMIARQCDLVDQPRRAATNPVRLLFVGQIVREKGVALLVEAAAILRAGGVPFELSFVGDGAFITQLSQMVKSHGLEKSVRVVGSVLDANELRSYFMAADMLLLPTTYNEGFPRVVYEAWTFGLPVVISEVPGARGVVRHEDNAFVVAPCTPEGFASAVEKLVSGVEMYERLSAGGIREMTTTFAAMRYTSHAEQLTSMLRHRPLGFAIADE